MANAKHESNGFKDKWAEQWFNYRFVTKEYAEKNAIKRPWGDILYKNLQPRTRDEAIARIEAFQFTLRGNRKVSKKGRKTALW